MIASLSWPGAMSTRLQPRLQYDLGVVNLFRFHCGHTFASSELMEPIRQAFVANVESSAQLAADPKLNTLPQNLTQRV